MSLEKIEVLEVRLTKLFELVKSLKEDKGRLEREVAGLKAELSSKRETEEEASRLRAEKEQVKERLERILAGIEELAF